MTKGTLDSVPLEIVLLMPESHRRMKVKFSPVKDSDFTWVEFGGVGAFCYQIPRKTAQRWIDAGVIQ